MTRRELLFAVLLSTVSACKPHTEATGADAGAAVPSAVEKAAKPALPPEPAPPAADKASEVPALEAALAKDAAYQKIWTGPRADLNAFLSYVSELVATAGVADPLMKAMQARHLHDPAVKVFMIFGRTGKFPAAFTDKFSAHLDATKSEPHLGTWSTFAKGATTWHDYTALAAWARPEDPALLREHIAARKDGAGPFASSTWQGKGAAPRPWLVDEGAALERLALLTKLTADEEARAAFLKAEAKKPRQPKLGEEFKLGDFAYTVKSVEVVDDVGTGLAKKSASEGARFVLVHFVIRNDANATETVLTDDFRIIDAQNREYRPSAEANTALVMSGGKDLGVTELQPGLKKTITSAFELPEAAAKGVFTLVIPEKGVLGTGSVRITLK